METIRQFAEEQLVHVGEADAARAAHARYFAGREPGVMALWDGPRQREAYAWLTVELANLRSAFRWAADHDDLDTAAAVANYAGFLGIWNEQYEPMGWAEELIDTARILDHQRLPQLCVTAAMCYAIGRVGDSVGFAEAARMAIESGRFDDVPFEFEVSLSATYAAAGETDRWVELCRNVIARGPGTHALARAFLVMGLTIAGATDEAVAMLEGLNAAADATDNPAVLGYALLARGLAYRDADGVTAYDAYRRGLTIAQDSGNRLIESASCGYPGAACRRTRRADGRLRLPDPGDPPLYRRGQLPAPAHPVGYTRHRLRPPRAPRTCCHDKRFRGDVAHAD